MHFAVDAHAIGRRLTGNEVYVRNLLEGFACLDTTAQFTAYYSVPEALERIPARFRKRQVACDPFLRLGLELSWKLYQDKPDLVHVQYTSPLACPVPVVVSVHDVSFLEHPEYFPRSRAWQLTVTVERTVRRAARILTPSEFSKHEIVRAYGLPEEKVTVVPNAVSQTFRPLQREAALARVAERFKLAAPFLFSVGDLQPRKNHIGLIEAFRELLTATPGLPHHLVLAGKETWFARRVKDAAQASGVGDRIHFLGFVSDEELIDLYNACEVFVFPSLYEGFGLPILEAMACGRAVACSNAAAMPEVANATALLFDPRSVVEMTRALRDLVVDAELRGRMERMGAHRAAHFTWQNAAGRTLDAYYDVAGQKQRSSARRAAPVTRP